MLRTADSISWCPYTNIRLVLVRHPNLDSRTTAGTRGQVHAAAGGLDTNTLRSKPDMSVGQPVGKLVGIETVAVVLNDERQLIVHPAQPDSDGRRLCVLDHIREELSGGREQKLLLRVTLRVSPGPLGRGRTLRPRRTSRSENGEFLASKAKKPVAGRGVG